MARNYYCELYFHFVWRTKHRAPLITQAIESALWAAIKKKCIEYGAVPIEVGGIEDHIHLLVSTQPTLLLSDFIGKVKGATSHYINHGLSPNGHFQWGEGYGVLSLAKKNVESVQQYIRNQRQHHQKSTINATLERSESDIAVEAVKSVLQPS